MDCLDRLGPLGVAIGTQTMNLERSDFLDSWDHAEEETRLDHD